MFPTTMVSPLLPSGQFRHAYPNSFPDPFERKTMSSARSKTLYPHLFAHDGVLIDRQSYTNGGRNSVIDRILPRGVPHVVHVQHHPCINSSFTEDDDGDDVSLLQGEATDDDPVDELELYLQSRRHISVTDVELQKQQQDYYRDDDGVDDNEIHWNEGHEILNDFPSAINSANVVQHFLKGRSVYEV